MSCIQKICFQLPKLRACFACGDAVFSAELENDGNDHAVEAEHLSEDKYQDKSHENLLVLSIADHALLAN